MLITCLSCSVVPPPLVMKTPHPSPPPPTPDVPPQLYVPSQHGHSHHPPGIYHHHHHRRERYVSCAHTSGCMSSSTVNACLYASVSRVALVFTHVISFPSHVCLAPPPASEGNSLQNTPRNHRASTDDDDGDEIRSKKKGVST